MRRILPVRLGLLLFFAWCFVNAEVSAQCVAAFTSTPAAPIAGCDPLNVLFYSNTTGTVVNRYWNFGDGVTSTAQNPSHVFTTGSADTVYQGYYAIECNGALRDTVFFQITVRARPQASFTSNKVNVCALTDSICFTNTSSSGSGYSYNWDFGDFSTSGQTSPCHIYNSPGPYTVKLSVTNNYGCIRQVTHNINVNDIPNTNFTVSSNSGCTPQTISFTNNTVAGSSPIVSWQWTYGDTSTPTILQNSSPHTYYTSGTYTITLKATNSSGCSNINTRTVIISTTPTVTINGPPTVCQGSVASFSYAGTASAGATYTWNAGGGTIVSGSGPGPVNVIWNSSGNKTISLTVLNTNGCSNSTSRTIKVFPKPVINLTSSKDTVCAGDTVIFTNIPSGYTQYDYFNNASLLSSTAQNVYTFLNFTAGTLVRSRALDSNGCYSDFDTAAVYVKPVPSVTLSKSPINDTICNGTSVTFTASPSGLAFYQFIAGFATVQSGASNTYTTSSVPNNVPVTVKALNNGCLGSASSAVVTTVFQRLPAPNVYCGTGTTSTIQFQWSSVAGAVGYKVSVNGGAFVNPSSGTNGLSHTVGGFAQGDSATIRVVAYDNSICNYGDTSIAFKCYALPCTPVSMTITPSLSVMCEGNTFSVSLSNISVPKYSISWDSGATYSNLTFYNYTAQAGKTYYVFAIDSAQLNCPVTVRTIPVTVNAVPNVTLSKTPNNSTICANTTITFTATPLSYSLYRFYNGTTLIQQGPSPYYTTNNLPTTNNIRVIAVNNGCASAASNAISTTVISSTVVSLTSTKSIDTVCQGENVVFTAAPGTYQTYKFYNGTTLLLSGGSNVLNVSSWTIPNNIYVIALDASGCNTDTSNAFSYFVKVTPNITLSSPINGDSICTGELATFSVSPSGLATYQFLINGNLVQSGGSNSYASTTLLDSQIVSAKASVSGCPPVNQSNSIMVRVKKPVAAPTVSCGTSTNSTITFTWDTIQGAIGYQVSVNGGAFNYPNTGQTGTQHIITGLSPGDSATIVVRALSGNPCDTSARSIPVKCYSIPCSAINFTKSSLPANICVGDSVGVYIKNISTNNYRVSWENGPLATDTNFRFKVLSDTIIHVSVKDLNQPSCPLSNKSFNVVTFKTPGVAITSNAQFFGACEGAPVTFTATAISSSYVYPNYMFYDGATLQQQGSSNTFITTALKPGNSIYVIAQSTSCQDVSNAISVNIVLKQKIHITSNVIPDSICAGTPVDYVLAPTSYQRYKFFNNSATLQDSTLNTISMNGLTNPNAVYGLATDINGCVSQYSDTITKFIMPLPAVTLLSNAPHDTICEQKPVTFVASPAGYSNYEFFLGFAPVQNGPSFTYSTSTLTSTKAVKVVTRNTFGCYDTSQSNYFITVISRLPAPNVYCGTGTLSSIQFRWDTVQGATGYLVSINGGPFTTPSTGPTGLQHQINGLNTGDSATIRVLAYNNSACQYGDTSLAAKCYALPCNFVPFTAAASVPSACAGDTVEFRVTNIGTSSYSLSFDNKFSYSTKVYDSIPVALSTNYYVYLIDSNQLACPPFYRNMPIKVNPIPPISLTADKDTVCETQPIKFTASPAGYANYQYYFNNILVQDSALQTLQSNQLQAGQLVRVRATDKGCSAISAPYSITVIQHKPVFVTNSTPNDTVCFKYQVSFSVAPTNFVNYKFYNNGVLLQNGPATSYTDTNLFNPNGVYVVARDAFGCEIHYSDTNHVYVKPIKFVNISSSVLQNKACQFDSIVFTALPANSFLSYRFTLNGVVKQNTLSNTIKLGNLNDGDSVQVFGLDSNGCDASSGNLFMTIQKRPSVTVTGDSLVCRGDSATLIATPDQVYPGITYNWGSVPGNGPSVQPIPTANTTYTVFASVNGCPGNPKSHTVLVDTLPKPLADAGMTRTGCIGDTVILSGSGGNFYDWQPAALLTGAKTAHPIFYVNNKQTFTVKVSNIKCAGTDTVTIFADRCLEDVTNIPQIITVNGDNVNDVFFIKDIDYFTNNTVTFYNRWGDEIFSAHPYMNTFDGKGKDGKELPEGVYYYVVDVGNHKAKLHKGMFIIER